MKLPFISQVRIVTNFDVEIHLEQRPEGVAVKMHRGPLGGYRPLHGEPEVFPTRAVAIEDVRQTYADGIRAALKTDQTPKLKAEEISQIVAALEHNDTVRVMEIFNPGRFRAAA